MLNKIKGELHNIPYNFCVSLSLKIIIYENCFLSWKSTTPIAGKCRWWNKLYLELLINSITTPQRVYNLVAIKLIHLIIEYWSLVVNNINMLSYLAFFIPAVIELVYWDLRPDESFCHNKQVAEVVGAPHALLVLNMALALTDRYIAINYPVWYREKMIVSLAFVIVILSFVILILFLIKFAFIVGLGAVHCEMWLVYANTISTVLVLLFVCGVVLNFISYVQSKIFSRETAAIVSSPNTINDAVIETENVEWIELTSTEIRSQRNEMKVIPSSINNSSHFVKDQLYYYM
jgi:hypothetical protein